ncbi:MAG: roadblock/LC7 domain-containing protein [Thermodesulfovibrionales bacterium]|nr:roadblock/LC7 domain-containing protein [Thermodesulfovibrionales bacterium]
MSSSDLIMYEEEFQRIDEELVSLKNSANASVVFLVDKNGQLIASVGDTQDVDTTSLASLTAGNIAATGGIAKLLGEEEFTILFHEGAKDNINISLIGSRIILAVVFDSRSSIGLVRLRVKKSTEKLAQIFDDISDKSDKDKAEGKLDDSPFNEISDDDIDSLFR